MVDRFKLDYFREGVYDIHCYYSIFANQYGSLTSVKYKKTFFIIRRLNENTHVTVIANITFSHFLNFDMGTLPERVLPDRRALCSARR